MGFTYCLHEQAIFDEVITQTAEYALRALVFLAKTGHATTTSVIATETSLPASYLAKVMKELCTARITTAQRGLNGGFRLTKQPRDISVLEVINAVDPIRRFQECPMGVHGKQLCPLHRKLDDAAQAVEDTFCGLSIADLLDVPQHKRVLCNPNRT